MQPQLTQLSKFSLFLNFEADSKHDIDFWCCSAESSVTLVDLEHETDELDKFEIFVDDHIHLSEEGRFLVGKLLFGQLEADGLLVPEGEGAGFEHAE